MSPAWAHRRLEDFEDFEDDWENEEPIQPIKRRDRPVSDGDHRREQRKRDRVRRREPPVHKREEP